MSDPVDPRSLEPAFRDYRMPPEWHPHLSTWLVWPKNPTTWPHRLPRVQETYLGLLDLLTPGERVDLLVDDSKTEASIRDHLKHAGGTADRVRFHHIRTADSWIRDYGPNFVLRRTPGRVEPAFNHWIFNAWGNKYEDLKGDGDIPERLETILGMPRLRPALVLEGGSIDVNGDGVCLSSERCLLNPNRNPSQSKTEISQFLKDFLGIRQIVWIPSSIAGDDTDGHVDNLARFANAHTIVCALEDDPADENYEGLQTNFQHLQAARDERGDPFEIIPLPMPLPVEGDQGRLPASYANFYIANQRILLPTFGNSRDAQATEVLQGLFPDRQVVGIDSRDLIWGRGALHCLTLQQPAVI
ncbi:MAG: agmatine deiminase family protein [Acidobacteriota bacterium]